MSEKSAGKINWFSIILIVVIAVLFYIIFTIDRQVKRAITEKDQTIIALTQKKNQSLLENERLKKGLVEAEKKLTLAGNKTTEFQTNLDLCQLEKGKILDQGKKLQLQFIALVEENKKMQEELIPLINERSDLQQRLTKTEQKLEQVTVDNQLTAGKKEKEIKKLEEALASLEDEFRKQVVIIKNLEKQLVIAREEVSDQQVLVEQIANLKNENENIKKEFESTFEFMGNENLQLEAKLATEQEKNTNLEKEKADLEEKLELAKKNKSIDQEERAELEKKLAGKDNIIQEQSQELTCQENEIASLKTAVAEKQYELKKKLTAAEQASAYLQNRITFLEKEKADLEKKVELAVNEKRSIVQLFNQEIASRDDEIFSISTAAAEQQDKLKRELTTAEQKVEKLQSELANLEKEKAGLEKKLELAEKDKSIDQGERAELEKNLAEKDSVIQELDQEIACQNVEIVNLKNDLSAQIASTEYYEEKSAEKDDIIEQLNQDLSHFCAKNKAQIAALRTKMENSAAEAKENLKENTCIINHLEAELKLSKQTEANLRAEIATLVVSDAKQRKENTELKENCDSFKEILARILEKTALPIAKFSFALGSSKIQEQESGLANEIKVALKNLDSESFFLIISGESDDVRFKANHDYNNWKLSANRALTISAALKKAGVTEDWMMQTHCLGLSQWKNCQRVATVYFIPNFKKKVMKEVLPESPRKQSSNFIAKIKQ
ncbi:MAG: hypothetical protein ABIG60_02565 [Patescibacteria group bacterium]